MNLTNLLNYQKADLAYKKLRQEISANPDRKSAKVLKEEFESNKAKMATAEAAAESVVATYNSALEYIDANVKRIDELCEMLADENISEEDEAKAVEELTAIQAEMTEWEKKAEQAKTSADKAVAEYQESREAAVKARDKYTTANERYKKFRDEKDAELNKLKAEVEKLAATVEPEAMDVYKLVPPEVFPAFVPNIGTSANEVVCGGCGMAVSGAAANELKSNGYCRCESCRRVIYKA